jgi:MFS family permease
MSPVFKRSSKEFGGILSLCFYLSGLVGAGVFGYLSSLVNRKLLLLIVCLVTSLGCILTALPESFSLLLFMRTISGFGMGGCLPVVNSLIGDWFSHDRRTSIAGIVVTMQGLGIFLGHQIGALFKPYWKAAFVVVGIPVLLLGLVYYQYADEPILGSMEVGFSSSSPAVPAATAGEIPVGARASKKQQLRVLNSRTNWFVLCLSFPGNIPSAILLSFLNMYLTDTSNRGMHMTTTQAALAEFVMGCGFFVGTVFGGILGSYLYAKDPRYAVLYCAFTCTFRALPAFFIVDWPGIVGAGGIDWESSGYGWFTLVLFIMGFLGTQHAAVTTAVLLNVNLPETRGTVAAMGSVLDDVSRAIGPLIFAGLCEILKDDTLAFQASLVFWVVSGLLLVPVTESLEQDEANMAKVLHEAHQQAALTQERIQAQRDLVFKAREAADAFGASLSTRTQASNAASSLGSTAYDKFN